MRSPRTREISIRTSAHEEDVPDWLSTVSTNSSTVATTASLSSRLAGLAVDLEDAAHKEQELGTFPEEEEEQVIENSEEVLLRVLDSQEDPFHICSRLFFKRVSNPVHLKKMNIIQMEEFKQHGYLILDNFISKEATNAIRQEALNLQRRGRLSEAPRTGNVRSQDNQRIRGDSFIWLHMGMSPLDRAEFASLTVAFHELQSDLQEFMKLKNSSAEYQLAYYPSNGAMYKKHRDAFPDSEEETQQRRVTAIVYMNNEWKSEQGGELRIWPPRKNHKVNHVTHVEQRLRITEQTSMANPTDVTSRSNTEMTASGSNDVTANTLASTQRHHYVPNISRFLNQQQYSDRRQGWNEYSRSDVPSSNPGVSEADISISEPSECGSLRSDLLDPALGVPKSTTSSVMADLGQTDGQFDVGSVDDMSVVSYFHEQTKNGVEWVEVGGEMVLDVAPLGGRCVLFLSGAVEHSVLPSNFERVAVKSWFQ